MFYVLGKIYIPACRTIATPSDRETRVAEEHLASTQIASTY